MQKDLFAKVETKLVYQGRGTESLKDALATGLVPILRFGPIHHYKGAWNLGDLMDLGYLKRKDNKKVTSKTEMVPYIVVADIRFKLPISDRIYTKGYEILLCGFEECEP